VRNLYWNCEGFPTNTLNTILEAAEVRKEDLISADTGVEGETTNTDQRSSKVLWLSDLRWLKDYLYDDWILRANREFFGFDVYNVGDIQYTEYHASEGDKYDWHIDTFWQDPKPFTRKLSMTIQLSDPSEYTGGEFQMQDVEYTGSSELGAVTIFPSYLNHRVTPLETGVRKSLVAWFEGPTFK